MNLPFELFVAMRYLVARRKQAFVSVISFVSILGVTVGVTALLIALALMTGLQGELRDRIIGASAHIYVFKLGKGIEDYDAEIRKLREFPHVTGAAPGVIGKALVTSSRDQQAFLTIKGIDPKLEPTVTDIKNAMRSGNIDGIVARDDQMDGIVLGKDAAESLGVSVGDVVRVLSPEGTLTPIGVMPRSRSFRVVGTFSLGLYEFDSEYGFMSLPVAERLTGQTHAGFIQLKLDDMFAARDVAAEITDKLGTEYVTQDWSDMNKPLFSALWLEKMAISITIGLIVMVAALNIIASLVLLVMEKSRDIAILKTMGSSAASIRRIFMLQGLIIGLIGTAAGAVLGWTAIFFLDRYKLIHVPIDVYQISYVPFTLLPRDFAIVMLAAIIVCFVATIYPSRQAAKLDPAQALRYQ